MSVSCSLVFTCWERADLLVFLYVVFSCVFVTFPFGVLGQVCYLIVSIPDLFLRPYFECFAQWFPRSRCLRMLNGRTTDVGAIGIALAYIGSIDLINDSMFNFG